jgi:hypothetical protein
MRGVALLALALLALAACASLQAGTSSTTALRISYWEDSSGGKPDLVRTLQCNPSRGTIVRPARACARLSAGGAKLFAAVPPNTVCTEIYGGPQKALVVGTVAGKRVWATFTRTNGCHIDRWNRLVPWLLPPGGVT